MATPFKDVLSIQYSEPKNMLYIVGGYRRKVLMDKKIIADTNNNTDITSFLNEMIEKN